MVQQVKKKSKKKVITDMVPLQENKSLRLATALAFLHSTSKTSFIRQNNHAGMLQLAEALGFESNGTQIGRSLWRVSLLLFNFMY